MMFLKERMELMYPMPTPQMPPIAPGASMLGRGLLQGGAANQLASLPLQQGAMSQSGGILSKLLGGAQAGGGGLNNILGMLQNAQKAIGVYQQVSPMVKQYAPFVKSLPALISMMRGSNSEQEETNENVAVEDIEIEEDVKKKTKKKKSKKDNSKTSNIKKNATKKPTKDKQKKKSQKEISKGLPAPKLYI
nr:VrrA/YqfQ family protein [Anaerobacillus isosaccharinicus]QOY36167.1 hypothetical protein AWH56_000255 [Anaerobacillus isosaccharinicus]